MEPINKAALRAAVLIREQLAGGRRCDAPIYLPEHAWSNIQKLRRQIGRARQRGWHGAVRQLTEELVSTVEECRRVLENAHRILQSHPTDRHLSSASDIYRDILALYSEFEDVKIDVEEHELSVTTDCIVLDDIRLGCFDIRLDWRRLGDAQPYRVVAIDPNPAARNEDVTHPHVQDEQLCEGDGRSAIQAALTECRLADFFLLVSQLLHTYGRGSAYVELDNWDGTPCQDCGDLVDEDSRYYCRNCDKTLCGSCSLTCHGCEESHCSECIHSCSACGEEFCSSCLETCRVCHERFCQDCLEAGLCHACHEEQANQEAENDPTSNTTIEQPAGPARGSCARVPDCIPA